MRKKILISIIALAIISPIVVVFLLYRLAMSTELPGRRGGPQDAFRHTYSTALTARYLSPKVVELVTYLSEREPDSPFDQMDIHNNRIGIQIGLGSGDLYQVVWEKIKAGTMDLHLLLKEINGKEEFLVFLIVKHIETIQRNMFLHVLPELMPVKRWRKNLQESMVEKMAIFVGMHGA